VSPLRGEKPQNWPLSKLNTGRFALRAMLPVKNGHLDTIAQLCWAIPSQLRYVSSIGKRMRVVVFVERSSVVNTRFKDACTCVC